MYVRSTESSLYVFCMSKVVKLLFVNTYLCLVFFCCFLVNLMRRMCVEANLNSLCLISVFSLSIFCAQVITTHGPRKPQRQSSNVNLSVECDLDVMTTPNNSHPMCLETSFTSLQSPGIGEPFPLISCSSKTSSMAGSLFGRSQLNSILHYDGTGSIGRSTSAVPSEATTVILADHSSRTKSVAFDIKSSGASTTSPSPNFFLKSILHRQNADAKRKSSIEQASQSRRPPPPRRIEFAKDDCLGMAPLASPETLSEISSISSRTSLAFNLASSIENYLHRINTIPSNANHIDENDLMESQMHTPKVMRRAPKITGNLSTCADDWQSVDKYKRMGKIFITNPVPLLSSNSSGDSFESTHSLTKTKCCTTNPTENSKSADNLDNDTPIKSTSFNTNKLTMSDSAILDGCNSKCPRCPCTRSTSSLRVPCCRRRDHTWCMEMPDDPSQNQTSSSDTYHSAFSSLATIDTYPQRSLPLPCGVLESHFPVYSENSVNESTSLLPSTGVRSPKIVRLDNNRHVNNGKDAGFKRYANDYENERRVSRNDSLPLLANLVERSSPNSFNRRRNHTVYPINSSPSSRFSPSKRTESNV